MAKHFLDKIMLTFLIANEKILSTLKFYIIGMVDGLSKFHFFKETMNTLLDQMLPAQVYYNDLQ